MGQQQRPDPGLIVIYLLTLAAFAVYFAALYAATR